MYTHKCLAGCGKAVTQNFAICANCEQIYGREQTGWPAWLAFLWNSTLQERRRNAKAREMLLDIDIYDYDEYISEGNYGHHIPKHRGSE